MASYYVNPSAGSDTNPGTEAGPFQTITKALSEASPGDTIFLARGQTFPAFTISSKDGTALNKYHWDAYGIGDMPIVSAFINPSGSWVDEGSNIWSYYNGSFAQVNSLAVAGAHKPLARWPKRTTAEYYDIDSASGNSSITDNTNLAAAPSFVGGELVSKKRKWTIDRATISGQTASTITVLGSGNSYEAGNGYFIQNHVNCCTEQGDWSFDFDTKKVYFYSTSDPNALDIRLSFDQYAMQLSNSDYHVFSNIVFEGAYDHNVFLSFSHNVSFDRCASRFAGKNGLQTYVSENATWHRSAMYDINNHGVNNRDASEGVTVTKSSFVRIAAVPGMGQSGSAQQNGVHINNTEHNATIDGNYFFQIGNCGVYYRGNNCYVGHNYAEKCGFTVSDAAAFYSFGSYSSPYTGLVCEYNIAYDCIGNIDGIGGTPKFDTCGFYTDDNCQNITVRFNYAKKCGYCYYIHNNQNVNYNNNIGIDAGRILYISDDNTQGAGSTLRIRNIDVQNNTFKALSGQVLIAARTIGDFSGDDPFLYGTIDNNQLDAVEATPFNVHLTNNYDDFYDLAGWRSNLVFDLGSNTDPFEDTEVIYLVNDTDATDTFPLTKVYKGWDNIQNDTGEITLDPNESVLLFEVEDLYFFTADVSPAGYGTADAAPSPVREDEEVTFTATPANGKQFVRWTEDGFEFALQNPLTFTPLLITNRSADLVAEFEDIPPPTFTLTVQESPGAGGSTVEVTSGPYEENDSVQVQASPASGYIFSHWEIGGSSVSTDADYTFAMPAADTTITAVFVAVFTVAISQNIPAGGSISEVTTGPYEQGDTVQVQATPATGYRFLRWEEGGLQVSESELYMFAMPAEDRNLVAVFELITYALTLTATPGGSGTLTGAGNQVPGAQVAVSASPSEGYSFAYWMEDGEVISTDSDFTYTMPEADSTLTAFFESTAPSGGLTQYQLTISTTPESGGTVTGANFYTEGDTVQVTATPSDSFPGNRFLYWKKDDQIVSYDEVYSFTMPAANTLLVAHFELSETSTAQAMDLVRDYIRISLTPEIPEEGIIEMEATLEFEQIYGTGTFTPIAEYLNPYLHELSRVDFHVDRALLGKMAFHRPNLALGLDTETLDGIVHRYRLRHALLVDGVQEGGESLTSSRHALLAGRPYTFPDVNPWEGKAYLWLTTRPMVRPVYPVEKSIFYVLPLETGEYTLEQTIHYKNTVKETVSRPLGTQERYRPFAFRYFLPEDWEDILQIELRLAGRILSEEVLTLRPQANPRYPQQVFYGNSLGGFDSFCFAGKKEQFSEASAEIFESNLQPDHDRQEGTLSAYNQLAFDSLILRTGYISLQDKISLKDMTLRNHAYLVSGSSLHRIVFQPSESFDQKDGDYIHGQEYRARLAHNNSSYYGRDPRQ